MVDGFSPASVGRREELKLDSMIVLLTIQIPRSVLVTRQFRKMALSHAALFRHQAPRLQFKLRHARLQYFQPD